MENGDISVLNYENQANNYLFNSKDLKKEKSLKSNYSNTSSVETQFDSSENNSNNTPSKSDTISSNNKDYESMNEVNTLINYNLSRKSSKMENNSMDKTIKNNIVENSANNDSPLSSKNAIVSRDNQHNSNNNTNSIDVNNNNNNNNSINQNKNNNNDNKNFGSLEQNQDSHREIEEKDKSLGTSSSSSVVYSYSLSTKKLTPKLVSTKLQEDQVEDISTNNNPSMTDNTPNEAITSPPEMDGKDILNSSFFNKIPNTSLTVMDSPSKIIDKSSVLKLENGGLPRSESSPSILKTDPNAVPINSSIEAPSKSNSQPPVPSTTFSNFKNKTSLNRIRKKEVIKELMESERLYVSDLQMLIENCFNPLEAVSWLPLNEKCLLIRNIQELFVFQQEFLQDMEESVKELKETINSSEAESFSEEELDKVMNECVRRISDCFIRRKKKFKVYSEFCSLHQEAINIFREYERKPEMISFIRDFNGKTHSRLHLQDFLIKPVQRICKYPLLLKEIIHYTDKDCEELNGLREALTVMSEVAREIDHVKWLIERVQRTDKFIDRLDIQDPFKYIIMERYGDMILSTGLEVIMEKERVNYRGVFLFRKHIFVVKPKRSKNYRVKMHLILDEFYFYPFPEYNAFRLIQKNTGIIIDFFAFSNVECKIWIELMETLVEPLDEVAEKNKVFYIKARNSYESHFSRFSMELKNLSSSQLYPKGNNLRRTASSSLVNSSLEQIQFTKLDNKRGSIGVESTAEKRSSADSLDNTTQMKELDSEMTSLTTTPKINPIQTSTSVSSNHSNDGSDQPHHQKSNSSSDAKSETINSTSLSVSDALPKRNSIYNGLFYSKKANSLQVPKKQNLHNTASVNSIKVKYFQGGLGTMSTLNSMNNGGVSSTVDTEISSNGSDILFFEAGHHVDHEIVNEPGIISEGQRFVCEPESIKSVPKKLDLISDTMSTISKNDSVTSSTILPPKYKLIDSKFYDVYTYLYTNNDIQKIFSNLMYRSHEFDHLLYHKKTTRSRSNSCPRERYIFKSSKDRNKEKEKFNANCCMTAIDDKANGAAIANANGNGKGGDRRSSLYLPLYNSDTRSIKSNRSSVNLYHLNEEYVMTTPTKSRKFGLSSQPAFCASLADDISVTSSNSMKYRKRHSISIFKSNSTPQAFEPTRSFVADSQITVVDSPASRCYSSLSDKMIDQDINFYFETMQSSENDTNLNSNTIDHNSSLPTLDTHTIHQTKTTVNTNMNSNSIRSPNSHRQTVAIMDANTLTSLNNKIYNDPDYNVNKTTTSPTSTTTNNTNDNNNNNNNTNTNDNSTTNDNINNPQHLTNTDTTTNLNINTENPNQNTTNSLGIEDPSSRTNYYLKRHSVAVDSNNFETTPTTPQSLSKVKNKKEKKVLFGNIKKIFSGGSKHNSTSSSSSSSTSSLAMPKHSTTGLKHILPKKHSSETNLFINTHKNMIKSTSLPSGLNKCIRSEFDISSLSPIKRSRSPLGGNPINNMKTSPFAIHDNNNLLSTPDSEVCDSPPLFEDEEIEEFSSLDHLGDKDYDPDYESGPKEILKAYPRNLKLNTNKILSPLMEEPKSSNSRASSFKSPHLTVDRIVITTTTDSDQDNNSKFSPKFSPTVIDNQHLSSPTTSYFFNGNNNSFNDKSLNDSYNSVQNHSFNSTRSNASVKSYQTNKSSSSSVVKKFYLDQKDIVIPFPGKKPSTDSLTSQTSNHGDHEEKIVLDTMKDQDLNSSTNNNDNDNDNGNSNSNNHSQDQELNSGVVVRNSHDNFSDHSNTFNENNTFNKNNEELKILEESDINLKENELDSIHNDLTHSTNSLINSTTNSSSNSNINSPNISSPNQRHQLKKNKTISLKLINLKKIF